MSSNEKGLSSPKGKIIMNYAYGVGASIVIIGALFKILHWPGAKIMLTLGMGTEALLFFLGAFEPPHEEATRWDWSKIYPALTPEKTAAEKETDKKMPSATKQASTVNTAAVQTPTNSIVATNSTPVGAMSGLSAQDMEKWNQNIKNISETVASLGKITDTAKVSEEYIAKLNLAGDAVENLSKAQEASAEIITSASEHLAQNYKISSEKFDLTMSTAAEKFDGAIEQSTDTLKNALINTASKFETNFTNAYNDSTNQLTAANQALTESYKNVSDALNLKLEMIKDSTSQTGKALQDVSKNLSAINAVYELQLTSINDELKLKEAQVATQNSVNEQLVNIKQSVMGALVANNAYQQESETLKNNIAELNKVYGNMLSSLNS